MLNNILQICFPSYNADLHSCRHQEHKKNPPYLQNRLQSQSAWGVFSFSFVPRDTMQAAREDSLFLTKRGCKACSWAALWLGWQEERGELHSCSLRDRRAVQARGSPACEVLPGAWPPSSAKWDAPGVAAGSIGRGCLSPSPRANLS